MAETATRTVYQIDVTGADAGARSMQNLAQSMGRTEQAFSRLSRPANDNARAFDNLAQKGQRVTQTTSAILLSLGRLDPAFTALGSSVGRATGAIGAMTNLISGPWGLAIGVGVTALGFFATAMQDAEKKAEAATEELKKQNKTLAERIELQRKATGTPFSFGGSSQDLQAQISVAEAEAKGATGFRKRFLLDNAARLRRLKEEQETQQRNAEDLKRINDLESASGFEDRKGGPREDKATFAGISEYAEQQRRLAAAEEAARGRSAIVGRMRTSDEMPQRRGETANDRFLKANKSKFDEHLAEARDTHKELEVYEKARMDAMAQYREASISGFKDIGSAGIQAFAALARGDKNVGKMLLSTVGNILVGRGTDALWQGIIMSANPLTPGLGAPLIAAGVGAIAAGVAMGAAGGSSAGGGGGGGSGVTSRPAAPATPNNAVTNTTGGQRPIVVNMPTVVAPGPHDGVRVRQALREAERHGV